MSRLPNEDYKQKTYPCKQCDANVVADRNIDDPASDIHGYKLYCVDCGSFVGWSGCKKDIKKNGERQFSSQWTAKSVGIDYCQICLRNKTDLGQSERVEPHHIIEISEGGEDSRKNIMWLCTCCHRLVHHQRTYLQKHFSHQREAYRAIQIVKQEDPDIYSRIIELYRQSRGNHGEQST